MSDDVVERLREIADRFYDDDTAMPYVGVKTAVIDAADEITRLRSSVSDMRESAARMVEAIKHVREIIKDAAMTGFNCHEGDWAERLFASEGLTFDALAAYERQKDGHNAK